MQLQWAKGKAFVKFWIQIGALHARLSLAALRLVGQQVEFDITGGCEICVEVFQFLG